MGYQGLSGKDQKTLLFGFLSYVSLSQLFTALVIMEKMS